MLACIGGQLRRARFESHERLLKTRAPFLERLIRRGPRFRLRLNDHAILSER